MLDSGNLRRSVRAWLHGPRLDDKPDTVNHLFQSVGRQRADSIDEFCLVHRIQLRDINYAGFGDAGLALRQSDVAGASANRRFDVTAHITTVRIGL